MKSCLLLWLVLHSLLCAQQGGVRIKRAVTDEELTKRRAQIVKSMPVVQQAPTAVPSITAAQPIPSIMSRSDILSFNGLMTLIPKRSILYQPPDFATRVNQNQSGMKIVGWLEFLQNNRGWVTTVNVSIAQAEGRVPIDEKIVELYNKGSNLVVATYRGGPISVLPPKIPEADAPKAEIKAK